MKFSSKNKIEIPAENSEEWQNIVNLLSEKKEVEEAIITRMDSSCFKIFKCGRESSSFFKEGEKFNIKGDCCNQVIKNSQMYIKNTLKNGWKNYCNVEKGMSSYFGLPLLWPDNEIFGTICVYNNKLTNFENNNLEKLLGRFKELIESHLKIIYQQQEINPKIKKFRDNFFDKILQTQGAMVLVLDTQGRILRFNKESERVTGYKAEEVVGKEFWDIFLPEFEFENIKSVFNKIVKENNFPNQHTNHWLTRENELRLISWKNTAISGDDGNVKFIIATGIDITEEREKEKQITRIKNILENFFYVTPDLLCIADMEGNFIRVNKAWEEILGYSSEELEQRTFLEFVHPDDVKKTKAAMEQLKTQKEVLNFVNRFRNSEGNYKFIEWRSHPEGDKIYAAARDITERKKHLEELKNKKEELSAANQQLTAYSEEITAMNEELEQSINRIESLNNSFNKMINLLSNMSTQNIKREEFLNNVFYAAFSILPKIDYGSVYTYENGQVNFIGSVGYELEELKQFSIPAEIFYNQNDYVEVVSTEKLVEKDKKVMDPELYENFYSFMNSLKETIKFDLEINGEKKAGAAFDISKDSEETFGENSKNIFQAFHKIATSFFELKAYNDLQSKFTKELITSIVQILEIYDRYTKGHSENVAEISTALAEEMGLTRKKIDDAYWAGMVHDIGKLLIPLSILNKKVSLTEKEYQIIMKHSEWGYQALSKSNTLKQIALYVKHHHERWDGNGYPDGLAGHNIPLISRILALADAWDAMTSERSYRQPFSRKKALEEIRENSGTQFDPEVVETFINSSIV